MASSYIIYYVWNPLWQAICVLFLMCLISFSHTNTEQLDVKLHILFICLFPLNAALQPRIAFYFAIIDEHGGIIVGTGC